MALSKIIWTLITIGICYLIVLIINQTLVAKTKDVIYRHQLRRLSYYLVTGRPFQIGKKMRTILKETTGEEDISLAYPTYRIVK
ncbi:MAG TPA: hypothetical protein EYP24_00870 [bacterium (Candidatus Stahlbacteria)]|nr:hypothetical protein [Candidatus Stahlbacteria bacterium]